MWSFLKVQILFSSCEILAGFIFQQKVRQKSQSDAFLCAVNRLGMYRDAGKQLKSALDQQAMVDIFLYLGKVYVRLDQPLTAIETYKQGLEKFPGETSLLTSIARIYEVCHNTLVSINKYKKKSKMQNCIKTGN